jgi:hypothetical protein
MSRRTSGIVLIVGLVVLLLGLNASESFSSEMSEAFSGAPSDKALWLLIVGGLLTAIGGIGWFRKPTSQPRS